MNTKTIQLYRYTCKFAQRPSVPPSCKYWVQCAKVTTLAHNWRDELNATTCKYWPILCLIAILIASIWWWILMASYSCYIYMKKPNRGCQCHVRVLYPQNDGKVCCSYNYHVDLLHLQNSMVHWVLHVIGCIMSEASHTEQFRVPKRRALQKKGWRTLYIMAIAHDYNKYTHCSHQYSYTPINIYVKVCSTFILALHCCIAFTVQCLHHDCTAALQ